MRFVQSVSVIVLLALASCGCQRTPESTLTGHPSTVELNKMVAEARTKADHQALAAHFRREAVELRDKQKENEDLGKNYVLNPAFKFSPSAYERCKKIADSFASAAESTDELASMHEEIAKNSAGQ